MFDMKRILLIASVCFCSFLAFSCSTDDGDNNPAEKTPTPTEDDRYYVKYEASGGGAYYYLQSVSVNTENGTRTFSDRAVQSFSQTFGPVKKGFVANISVVGSSNARVSIYVCKGEEPFALKQTGTTKASYTIDF
jgi:hypothetical protein